MFRLLVRFGFAASLLLAPVPMLQAQSMTPDLLVSSRNTNSVKRYDGTTGTYLGDFVAPGAGGIAAPQDVALGLDGALPLRPATQSDQPLRCGDGRLR
ncbi:MAG: hypothetical protein HKN04_00440 [Rhodothermaceae bacterium]|nr:hypothetical protein [Rhodothermaceae bacterium]